RPLGLARVFRIGKRDHLALSRFADQQRPARAEGHHARAVHFFGKNRDMESRRSFQSREIETSFLGAGEIGKRGVSEVCDYARQHCDERQKNNSYSLQDGPTLGHCCLSSCSAIGGSDGRILLLHAVFISAPAKITANRSESRGDDEVEYL